MPLRTELRIRCCPSLDLRAELIRSMRLALLVLPRRRAACPCCLPARCRVRSVSAWGASQVLEVCEGVGFRVRQYGLPRKLVPSGGVPVWPHIAGAF